MESVADPFNPNAWVEENGWHFERVGGTVRFRPAGHWTVSSEYAEPEA